MRPKNGQARSERQALKPFAMGNSIEPLDQIDVAIEDAAKIERRHIETTFGSKTHRRKFHPALGETVATLLELGDPWLFADRSRGLGACSAKRGAGRQERAQVLIQQTATASWRERVCKSG